MQKRRLLVLIIIAAILCVFAARLVQVQLVNGPELAAQAQAERSRAYTIVAQRGDILDSEGRVMATSVKRYNIGVNQVKINTFAEYEIERYTDEGAPVYKKDAQGKRIVKAYGPVAAAKLLAPLLEQDPVVLGGKMVSDKPSTFVYIAKNVSPETWRKIRKLGIPGIEPEEVQTRTYPNGNTAGNIIGFTDAYGKGIYGLELTQEERLAGKNGKSLTEIGRRGQVIPGADNQIEAAVPGQTVNTSINLDLQALCQQQLDQGVAQVGAQHGMAVVEEVGTGRILALCDSATVDPSQPTKTPADLRGAQSVSTVYEPGSTVKMGTMSTALDQDALQPLTPFTVPYKLTMPNGQTFQDSEAHGLERLTAAGVLAKSSNVGTIQIGDLVKDSVRYEYLRKMGFGQTTGIELPGESAGIFVKPEKWDGRQRYTTMFGQGMAATILQVAAATATVANDGVRVPSHLIDSYVDANGKTITPKRQANVKAMEPKTAQTVLRMMEGVVSKDGTAPNAQIDGYRVAGKTGTTQILAPNGQEVGTVASFTGIVPADKPRVVVAVVIYRPATGVYGSVVAVPIFKSIATAAMRELRVGPSESQPELFPIFDGVAG